MTIVPELEARQLSVDYGAGQGALAALDAIDLVVSPGTFVAILGPSGSGKTTLLNVFAGLISPSRGRALFRGQPIFAPSADRSMVFQRHALLPWLNVADNVAFPLKLRGVDGRGRRNAIMPLLIQVGLAEFADKPVWTLSGGMQQRVGLARALAADPAVLLLDEPLGALDAITREDLQRVLLDLWALSAKTAVLITHDIEEAVFLATHLVVLSPRPGRIVARFELPFSRRVAAGEEPRAVRAEADFAAIKAELRGILDKHAAGARTLVRA